MGSWPVGIPSEERPTLPLPTPGNLAGVERRKLVVILEPSLTIRAVMTIALQAQGCDVRSFGDGIAFFYWLQSEQGRVPALIFLETLLPKMDGYEVAKRLGTQAVCARTILYFVSRKDRVGDRLKGRLVGARGYLTKPFRIEDLVAIAQEELDLAPPFARRAARS